MRHLYRQAAWLQRELGSLDSAQELFDSNHEITLAIGKAHLALARAVVRIEEVGVALNEYISLVNEEKSRATS